MRKLMITCCLLFGGLWLHAQEENIWVFGLRAGLDFNGSAPVTFSTAMPVIISEGCANVCNASGQLLFATDGFKVLDRNYNIMPNGNGLITDIPVIPLDIMTSCSQGTLIVPMPDNSHKYYVFSLTPFELNQNKGRLYYSVVDMNGNGGMGDVEPGQKGILLDTVLTEHISGVAGDNCNAWVVVASSQAPQFKSFEISNAGVSSIPVISAFTGLPPAEPGRINIAPNRKKLAIGNLSNLELYDFDTATGLLSGKLILDTFIGNYGVCFSPDNSKLYANAGLNSIVQYDLSAGTTGSIIASRNILVPSAAISDIKRGPDGKVYWIQNDSTVGRINAPDLYGAACMPNPNTLLLPGTTMTNNGFPNVVPTFLQDTSYTTKDTFFCSYQDSFLLYSPLAAAAYLWEDGSTAARHTITNAGTYWVRSNSFCHYRVDTFKVEKIIIAPDLGPDTTLCTAAVYVLDAEVTGSAAYLWQDGSSDNTYAVNRSGTYWVSVSKGGCIKNDTVTVTINDDRPDLGQDINLCKGEPVNVSLIVQVPAGSSVTWSTGNTGPSVLVTDTGTVWVTVTHQHCIYRDSLHIGIATCTCMPQMPTAFSPNGDALNDSYQPLITGDCPITQYSLNIYNRYGQRVYQSVTEKQDWDGTINGSPADVGVYMYQLHFIGGTREIEYTRKGDLTLIR
jgi:gliding motility-associated-like protein